MADVVGQDDEVGRGGKSGSGLQHALIVNHSAGSPEPKLRPPCLLRVGATTIRIVVFVFVFLGARTVAARFVRAHRIGIALTGVLAFAARVAAGGPANFVVGPVLILPRNSLLMVVVDRVLLCVACFFAHNYLTAVYCKQHAGVGAARRLKASPRP